VSNDGVDDSQSHMETPAKKKKMKRTVKVVPDFLACVTKNDLSGFIIQEAKEKDTSEETFRIVNSFVYKKDDDSIVTVQMMGRDINLDQIRQFCKQIGIKGAQNSPKFDCLVLIALAAEAEVAEVEIKTTRESNVNCRSGHCCKFINCLFHPNHHDNYFRLNDIKTRKDHEGLPGGFLLPSQFWNYIAEVMGSGAEEVEAYSYDPSLHDDDLADEQGQGTDNLEKELQTWWKPNDTDLQAADHMEDNFYLNNDISLCAMVPP